MTNINNDTRRSFFPNSKTARAKAAFKNRMESKETDTKTKSKATSNPPVSIDIKDEVRDFARIKELATNAPEIDNSEKIARLKEQINSGTYEVDYDKLADKLLMQEFN